jgi:RNA polymerase sigma-B factor
LDSTEARRLVRKCKSDGPRGKELLVEAYAPLVGQLARRYSGRGEPMEDLLQVGMVGLLKAIDRFDPDRGVAFSTYAFPCVLGEIKRHFRDRVWAVCVPRPLKELGARIPIETERLKGLLGRAPTITELAEALESDEEAVLEAIGAWEAYSTLSFNTPSYQEEDTSADLLDRLGKDEDGYERAEEWASMRAGIAELDKRERQIVFLYFNRGLTQSEIATRLGYSQMHISRLLRAALDKIRVHVAADVPAAA